MKRAVFFLLLVSVAVLALSSCDLITSLIGGEDTTGTSEVTTTAAAATDFTISYEALASYRVTYPEGDSVLAAAADTLSSHIYKKSNVRPSVGESYGVSAAKEIALVDASVLGLSYLRVSDYRIVPKDNTVYIAAGSAEARAAAFDALLSLMKNRALTLPADGVIYNHSYTVGGITLNGADIAEYVLLADDVSRPYAELLRESILAMSGIPMQIAAETEGKSIAFLDGVGTMTATTVAVSGDALTLGGCGKSGMYYSAMAFLGLLEGAMADGSIEVKIENSMTLANAAYMAPSSAAFYDENGDLDVDGDGKIHIVFIGGSLTQTNEVWCPPVVEYFRARFPHKEVTYTNAAIGATDSTMGAARLAHDVLDQVTPDIVFVEYAVNDGGYGTESDYALKKNGVYIESIIRQCMASENQPAVALLYFPRGFVPGSTDYNNWKNGVALKERIAAHYGIASVNVLDYVEALYASRAAAEPGLTYEQFLSSYYNASDMVHPKAEGYAVFRDAILAALDADFESFLTNKVGAPIYLTDYEREILTTYKLKTPNGSGVRLDGNFVHYEEMPAFGANDPEYLPANTFEYPRFTEGVWQIEDGSSFTITVTTTADVIGIYGLHSPGGMEVEIYDATMGDGVLVGSVDIGENHVRPYLVTFALPEGRSRYTVKIRPAAGTSGDVFRIGYIIEGTYAE